MRGALHQAGESVADKNVHLILDQQIREASAFIQDAKRSLAVAMAHQTKEEQRLTGVIEQIEKLEARAVSALKQSKEALAIEAAETIAELHQQEKDAQESTQRQQKEIDALAQTVRDGERRLIDLKRRQTRAKLMERTSKLRTSAPLDGASPLSDAAETLSKLEERCAEMTLAADALDRINQQDTPQSLERRLADAGCGDPVSTPSGQILERLRKAANEESIFFMEASFAAKGFYAMSALMLVHTSISITKTLRDGQEADRLINRIEDAKTERLLMDVNGQDAA
eukprot:s1_g1438.t1